MTHLVRVSTGVHTCTLLHPCTHTAILRLKATHSHPFSVFADALIAAINHDIEEAKRKLDLPEHLKLKKDNFFIASASSSMTLSNKITKGH